jgi:photosystem II stability/assembly factor-like uncharacterized protein
MINFARHRPLITLPAVLMIVALTLAATGSAFAVDLLELPAVKSNSASRTLLLDATTKPNGDLVAVGTYGVIIESKDDGATWLQADVPASVTLTGVSFPSPEKGWAVGHDGLILHSEDGGLTWRKQLDGYQLNEQILAVAKRIVEHYREELEALEAEEEPDEYAIDDARFMLEEAEFALEGAMDDTEAGPVRPLLDVWFRDDSEGFVVGSYGMLLHTVDGGDNWALVSDRMDNAQGYHLNQIAPAPDGALFIAGEAGFVYRSTDGGISWDTLEPGYEGSFYGVIPAPTPDGSYEILAYGLRGNLFHSTDEGDNWEALDSGTTITLLAGTLLSDGTVYLAGQGGTILTRAPGEQTFTRAQNPNRRPISGVEELPDGHVLLVGLGGVRATDARGNPVNHPMDAGAE